MMRAFVVLLMLLVASTTQERPRFRASAEAVTVDVLVVDGTRPVAGLTAADFELRDSGIAQSVTAVAMADVPVSVMLALDTSNSVRGPALARLKNAALAALEPLREDDRAALLTFNHAVVLRAGWAAPSAAFRRAVHALDAGGFTSLNDGVFTALQLGDTAVGRRSLVIVFTDGGDSASWLPARAILEKARRADAVVYAVIAESGIWPIYYGSGVQLWRDAPPSPLDRGMLQELTDLTGGERYYAGAGLRETFRKIVTDFRNRYVLTYTPEGVDAPGWHPIEVKLKGRKGTVRARRGYVR